MPSTPDEWVETLEEEMQKRFGVDNSTGNYPGQIFWQVIMEERRRFKECPIVQYSSPPIIAFELQSFFLRKSERKSKPKEVLPTWLLVHHYDFASVMVTIAQMRNPRGASARWDVETFRLHLGNLPMNREDTN